MTTSQAIARYMNPEPGQEITLPETLEAMALVTHDDASARERECFYELFGRLEKTGFAGAMDLESVVNELVSGGVVHGMRLGFAAALVLLMQPSTPFDSWLPSSEATLEVAYRSA